MHRDLKPENLLFRTPEDNADLLIADFGLSRIMDEEAFHVLTTTCGTPGYMAPEIFKKTGHGKPVYVRSPHSLIILKTNNKLSDVWAIGVITYFLLCGYTPFDRESNLEEMQAILVADYSFTPVEYWRGVSNTARQFIKQCLTIDPTQRMTAHSALTHPWLSTDSNPTEDDLLPVVKKNFNARRTLHAAIDTVRAINKLREGGAMNFANGARRREAQQAQPQNTQAPAAAQGRTSALAVPVSTGDADGMEVDGEPGEKFVGQGGDEMEIDSQGHGRGQTEEMIRAQEEKIKNVSRGLWSKAHPGGGHS